MKLLIKDALSKLNHIEKERTDLQSQLSSEEAKNRDLNKKISDIEVSRYSKKYLTLHTYS